MGRRLPEETSQRECACTGGVTGRLEAISFYATPALLKTGTLAHVSEQSLA
ncbi:MAG: hypothetical protein ACPLPR_09960 [Bacillota bacterium]